MKTLKPFLLPLLALIGIIIFKLLYGQFELPQAPQPSMQQERVVTNEALLEGLSAQLASRSAQQVGRYIAHENIPLQQEKELIQTIITDKAYGFTDDDAIQLILHVANDYAFGSPEQEELFSLLVHNDTLVKENQPLFIAIDNDYEDIVAPLLSWAAKVIPFYPQLAKDLKALKDRTLKRAIEENKVKVVRAINRISPLSKQQATDLVWLIAQHGVGASLLPELKQIGADINQARAGKTPLIQATGKGYQDVVEGIIAAGADLNIIVDPAIGSAVQQAFEHKFRDIETMLRDAGAHE